MRDALMIAAGDEAILAQQEAERLGFDHAEVSARLLERWKLPESTCEAIRYHHCPTASGSLGLDVAVVHLADALANRVERAGFSGEGGHAATVDPAVWAITGLSEDTVEGFWPEVDAEFSHAVKVLRVDSL